MIRPYQLGDHTAIAEIFCRAIHEVASEHYTPQQCQAWSDRKPNPDHWLLRCETKQPLVYLIDEEVAGFLEVDPDGHLDCLYVHPRYARRGIATALVRQAIETICSSGVERVYVEASHCAQPMFDKLGFETIRENVVRVGGEELVNFVMERKVG